MGVDHLIDSLDRDLERLLHDAMFIGGGAHQGGVEVGAARGRDAHHVDVATPDEGFEIVGASRVQPRRDLRSPATTLIHDADELRVGQRPNRLGMNGGDHAGADDANSVVFHSGAASRVASARRVYRIRIRPSRSSGYAPSSM